MKAIMRIWYASDEMPFGEALGVMVDSVKLTDFGAASQFVNVNKEDERAAALARRAQHGDYDQG